MATKITWTSNNPHYQSFPVWFKQKVQHFEDTGNTVAANAWKAALAAKEASMATANYTADHPDEYTIITNTVAEESIPAFTNIQQLWIHEYGVVITTTEV